MTHVSPNTLMPPKDELLRRYHELRSYVDLSEDDVQIGTATWPLIAPQANELIEDFYSEILRHPETASVIRGGEEQVARLKSTLLKWLAELFQGNFDADYVSGRWAIGWRHAKIGLSQMWVSSAMSRLGDRLISKLAADWDDSVVRFQQTSSVISRLIDLDLMLIQDAYHTETVADFLQGEKELNKAIIGTTQAIVLTLDHDGTILHSNEFLSKLVANEPRLPESIKTIRDLIPQDSRHQIEDLLSQDRQLDPSVPAVTELVDTTNRTRTIRWFARTITYSPFSETADGRMYHLLTGHDVTDLVEAQRRAVQQERLAAIGQTMAGLAHESRNAFQRSQAGLETLALELEENPDSLKLVERIQRANDHLLHLYQEVLQFAKPMRLDLHESSVPDIARATIRHLIQGANQDLGGRLTIQVDPDVESIQADSFAVEQVLRNLIENAIAFSPPNKPVQVTISATWQGRDPAVRVEVQDWGPGIPDEYKERIFEPFFSTRSRGTGLGLPIARRLVEAHGGSLKMKSSDNGTVAILELPRITSGDTILDPEDLPDPRRSSPK